MNPIVQWLQSPEGEEWSENFHRGQNDGGRILRHSQGVFATIKWDHENCNWNALSGEYIACGPSGSAFAWTDRIIIEELEKYGLNGIPDGRGR
jgi:hypothetical protein